MTLSITEGDVRVGMPINQWSGDAFLLPSL